MKKLAFSAVAFAMATSSLTPAMAAPILFSAIPTTQQQAMQTTCNGFIPGGSPFVAAPTALDATVTEDFEVSRTTITNIPGGQLISQTPFVFTSGSEHKSGQSPNVFGDFTSTATYSGGLNVQEVVYADRTVVTFGCRLTKANGELAPNGQQVANDGTLFVNFDQNTYTDTETVSAPNTTQTVTESQVICISPSTSSKGTKSDGWRGQNGYPTANCTTNLYISVNPGGTHSNSVPDLAPLRPNTDHFQPLPFDSLESSPLPWDGEEA